MTTLGTISSTTATTASQYTQRKHQEPSLDNTAKLLGMSTDDLKTAMKSGKTLNDLASEKGVSSSDLTSAIKQDVQANKPAGAPDLSDDQLNKVASDIASGKKPQGHHHGGHKAQSSTEDNLTQLASNLGVDQDDLLSSLNAGQKVTPTYGSLSVDGGVAVDAYV